MVSTPVRSTQSKIQAVCFDYRGVLLDHRTNQDILPGMEDLLRELKERGMRLAIVSRFPLDVLKDQIEDLQRYFGEDLCSSSGRTKLDCVRELADGWGINDLGGIAFIDDKPENLLSLRQHSKIHVIGFLGSGKYPESRDMCLNEEIPFSENVRELKHLLLDEA